MMLSDQLIFLPLTSQVVQRVVFLHEDLVRLPTFPRKALESELDLYEKGEIGKVRLGDWQGRLTNSKLEREDSR